MKLLFIDLCPFFLFSFLPHNDFVHWEDWSHYHTSTFHCLSMFESKITMMIMMMVTLMPLIDYSLVPIHLKSEAKLLLVFSFLFLFLFFSLVVVLLFPLFSLTEISQVFKYFSHFPWCFLCCQLIVCSQADNIFFWIFSFLSLLLLKDCVSIQNVICNVLCRVTFFIRSLFCSVFIFYFICSENKLNNQNYS